MKKIQGLRSRTLKRERGVQAFSFTKRLRKKWGIIAAAALLFGIGTAIIISKAPFVSHVPALALRESAAPQLIIDAGHGGMDGGASTADGVPESQINLSIAHKMCEVARLFGIEPIMTRERDALDYPENAATIHEKKVWDQNARVSQINAVENAVLISIHQNYYPDPRPCGTEVLYGKAEGSEALAQIMQTNLIAQLCPENRRVAAPASDKIYLMKQVQCTAVLTECGFLSNQTEAAFLKSDNYQTKLAMVLTASYLQYTG